MCTNIHDVPLLYQNMETCDKQHIKSQVKHESFSGICQCCLSSADNLRNMLQICLDNDKNQSYSDMLCYSFGIKLMEIDGDSVYLICSQCILKLRDSYVFRHQVEDSQRKLKQQKNEMFEECYYSEIQIKDEPISKSEPFPDDENSFDVDSYDYDAENCDDSSTAYQLKGTLNRSKVSPESTTKPRDESPNTSNSFDKLLPKASLSAPSLVSKIKSQTQDKSNKPVASVNNTTKKKSICKTQSETDKNVKRQRQSLNRPRKGRTNPFSLEVSAVSCNECNEVFPTHRNLVRHMASHFPNHVCDLCGKLYVTKEGLASHINTHNNEKIACPVCQKLLKKASMSRHARGHTGDNCMYKCQICHVKFVSHSSRVVHMKKVHKILGSLYKCKMCPKTYEISGYLAKHVRKDHLQEKNHTCSYCKHAFFSKHELKVHMVSHTGEKNFQCKICSKSYSRRQALSLHNKIHSNIKKHVCQICDKRFTQKCTLKGHMKVHEKPELSLDQK